MPENQTRVGAHITLLGDGSIVLMTGGTTSIVAADGPYETEDGAVYRSSLGGGSFQYDVYKSTPDGKTNRVSTLVFDNGKWREIHLAHSANEPHINQTEPGQDRRWKTLRGISLGEQIWSYSFWAGTIVSVSLGKNDKVQLLVQRNDVSHQSVVDVYCEPKDYWQGMTCVVTMIGLSGSSHSWPILFDSFEADYKLTKIETIIWECFEKTHRNGESDRKKFYGFGKMRSFYYRFWLNSYYAHYMRFYSDSRQVTFQSAIQSATRAVRGTVKKKLRYLGRENGWTPPAKWNKIECDEAFIS